MPPLDYCFKITIRLQRFAKQPANLLRPESRRAFAHPLNSESRPRFGKLRPHVCSARFKSAVLNSLTSADAQRGYRHVIDEFVEWYCSEPRLSFNRTVVLLYRMHLEARKLAPGTINLRLGAVRRLAYEASGAGRSTRCALAVLGLSQALRQCEPMNEPESQRF
jgi:hypothetical protein